MEPSAKRCAELMAQLLDNQKLEELKQMDAFSPGFVENVGRMLEANCNRMLTAVQFAL